MTNSKIFRKNNFILYSTLIVVLLLFSLSAFKAVYAQEEEKPCPKPYIKNLWPRAAKPGDEIKIRGNRFGEKQGSVTFAPGVRARILMWTHKRIVVVVPDGVKTGPVFLNVNCGETVKK